MASGSPSSRWQISATAAAFSLVTAKSGLTSTRPLDEQAHGFVLAELRRGGGRLPRSGSASGGTGILVLAAQVQRRAAGDQHLEPRAPPRAARPRLARRRPPARSCRAAAAVCRSRRYSCRRHEQRLRPLLRARRALRRSRRATSAGSRDRRQRDERRRRRGIRRAARPRPAGPGASCPCRPGRSASRAGPPAGASRAATAATSRSRPISGVGCTGRLLGRPSSVRSGGNSAGRPGAADLPDVLRPHQSLSRCAPRSRRVMPGGKRSRTSSAVASVSRIWPPWPAASSRASRFSAGPT